MTGTGTSWAQTDHTTATEMIATPSGPNRRRSASHRSAWIAILSSHTHRGTSNATMIAMVESRIEVIVGGHRPSWEGLWQNATGVAKRVRKRDQLVRRSRG